MLISKSLSPSSSCDHELRDFKLAVLRLARDQSNFRSIQETANYANWSNCANSNQPCFGWHVIRAIFDRPKGPRITRIGRIARIQISGALVEFVIKAFFDLPKGPRITRIGRIARIQISGALVEFVIEAFFDWRKGPRITRIGRITRIRISRASGWHVIRAIFDRPKGP